MWPLVVGVSPNFVPARRIQFGSVPFGAWSHGFAAVDPKGEKEWEGGDKRAAPEDALHSIREAAEEDARWSYYAQGHFSLMKYNIFFN